MDRMALINSGAGMPLKTWIFLKASSASLGGWGGSQSASGCFS